MKYLTTKQAGEELGIGNARVRQLILTGRLKAQKFGSRDWLIRPRDLEAVKFRPTGRPPKKARRARHGKA